MAGGAPLLEVRNVTKRFGDFVAVDDVSLAVGPGEVVGLLGANGAGKTTVLRIALGLLASSSGRALLLGAGRAAAAPGRPRLLAALPGVLSMHSRKVAAPTTRHRATRRDTVANPGH